MKLEKFIANANIRAVFLDIDGTLVSFATHCIPQSTLDAIHRVREHGVKVFIATGRPRPFIDNLGSLPYDGMLCTNGATCLEADGTCFHLNPIPRADIERYIAYQQRNPIPTILANNESVFIANPEARAQEVHHIMTMLNIKMPPVRPIEEALGMDIVQAVAFIHPNEEEEIMRHVLCGCDAERWHASFADIIASGTNKAAGIDVMLAHYGISLSETMAFGDGGNDIEMLRHVTYGVAMGNASPDVKAAADFVTTSVDDHGIANVLNHLTFAS